MDKARLEELKLVLPSYWESWRQYKSAFLHRDGIDTPFPEALADILSLIDNKLKKLAGSERVIEVLEPESEEEKLLMLLEGLVFHAQESCKSQKRYADLGWFREVVSTLIADKYDCPLTESEDNQ